MVIDRNIEECSVDIISSKPVAEFLQYFSRKVTPPIPNNSATSNPPLAHLGTDKIPIPLYCKGLLAAEIPSAWVYIPQCMPRAATTQGLFGKLRSWMFFSLLNIPALARDGVGKADSVKAFLMLSSPKDHNWELPSLCTSLQCDSKNSHHQTRPSRQSWR